MQTGLGYAKGHHNLGVFNALAAAYAASGDFVSAVHWQTRASQWAPGALKALCLERLELYQAGRVFHIK